MLSSAGDALLPWRITEPSMAELSGAAGILSLLFSSVRDWPASITSTPATSIVSAVAAMSTVQVFPDEMTARSEPPGTPEGLQLAPLFQLPELGWKVLMPAQVADAVTKITDRTAGTSR